jgi:uncharacterized protein YcbX
MIRVSGIFIYPVKSCGGSTVQAARVGATGFDLDRRWMVVDGDGQFLTQRKHPSLALVNVRVEDNRLVFSAEGLRDLEIFADGEGRLPNEVKVWKDTCRAVDEGGDAASWFSEHLGLEVRLVRLAGDDARPLGGAKSRPDDFVSFADAFPFLLLSQESLDGLNERLAEDLPMNRFRPNIVVSGCRPHAEDDWNRISIGGLPFRVAKPCARCVVTTTDQATGERGPEPLRTLAGYRSIGGEVLFGQNLIHEGRGVLRVGDEVTVLT